MMDRLVKETFSYEVKVKQKTRPHAPVTASKRPWQPWFDNLYSPEIRSLEQGQLLKHDALKRESCPLVKMFVAIATHLPCTIVPPR